MFRRINIYTMNVVFGFVFKATEKQFGGFETINILQLLIGQSFCHRMNLKAKEKYLGVFQLLKIS